MFGGVDPRKMKAMMSQMGIKQEEIGAEEVVIKGKDKNIIIREPTVVKINFSGQETFQISGRIETEDNEDVKIVMAKANVSKEKAKEALKKSEGNIAEAILGLKD